MSFYETTLNKKGKYFLSKWEQYFHIYNKFLAPFKAENKPVNIMEIGVNNGGSLELWEQYLPKDSKIVGIDIDERCRTLQYDDQNVKVLIGDASDENFINKELKDDIFDIIIDDGSHICWQVIKSFEMLFDKLEWGGLYIIEDVHTSYFDDAYCKGGYKKENSTIEYFKELLDCMNFDYIDKNNEQLKKLTGFQKRFYKKFNPASFDVNDLYKKLEKYNKEIASMSFYDSVIVIEKYNRKKDVPFKNLWIDGENVFGSREVAIERNMPEFSSDIKKESFYKEI